jgi:integrase
MKTRTGYTYYDEKRKSWVARFAPIDPTTGKRQNLKRYADTKAEAARKLRKMIEEYEQKGEVSVEPGKMTFAELAERFKKERLIPAQYAGEKKVAGRRELSAPKAFLKALTEHFGRRKLADIKHADIEQYKLKRLQTKTYAKRERTIAAVNRELEFFRTVLNYAVANKLLSENPFNIKSGRPLIEKAAENKRERVPGFGEELALLSACTGDRAHLKPILIVAADTGLRMNELLTLGWADTNFEQKQIKLRAFNAKTNRARSVPMTTRVLATLIELRSCNEESDLVFGGLKEVKRSFKTACKLAGVKDLNKHDFRHAFVTRAILAGVPPAVALQASGHASEEWKRYLNVTPETLKGLFAPLPGQDTEVVKQYGLEILRGLRDALKIDDLLTLLAVPGR